MAEVNGTTIAKYCGYLFAGIVGATGLSHQAIVILGVLMILDVITGIARSGTVSGWRSITSMRLSAGVIAKLLMMIIPLVIAIAGIGAGIDLAFVASSSLSILIMSEAYSVLGNIYGVATKKQAVEFDAIGYILGRFREILEAMLQSTKKK
jgi:hypothetical protein